MLKNEIEDIKNQFVENLLPIRIYLFDSYADKTFTDDSDFDFYIVVDDNISDLADLTAKAYKSIRRIKKRPKNILVGTNSKFKKSKNSPTIENEVYRKGVLLYGTIVSHAKNSIMYAEEILSPHKKNRQQHSLI